MALNKKNKLVVFLAVIIGSLGVVMYLDATGKDSEAENVALLMFAGLVIVLTAAVLFRKPHVPAPTIPQPAPVIKTYQFY